MVILSQPKRNLKKLQHLCVQPLLTQGLHSFSLYFDTIIPLYDSRPGPAIVRVSSPILRLS